MREAQSSRPWRTNSGPAKGHNSTVTASARPGCIRGPVRSPQAPPHRAFRYRRIPFGCEPLVGCGATTNGPWIGSGLLESFATRGFRTSSRGCCSWRPPRRAARAPARRGSPRLPARVRPVWEVRRPSVVRPEPEARRGLGARPLSVVRPGPRGPAACPRQAVPAEPAVRPTRDPAGRWAARRAT